MAKAKALFLDRDGVINIDRSYVHSPDEFHFTDGIFELCRAAQILGYLLIVVTNQAGIARGYYTESAFLDLTDWMIHRFAERQIQIARVYYCPYHPVHGVGGYKRDSADRKPRPGMLLRARADFDLDLASSVLVGDTLSDIHAAKAAAVGLRILLHTANRDIDAQEDLCYVSGSLEDIRYRFFSPAR
jgi:D-glycero-D-manno-heptose 1,7-bisphosphate phosphatase